MQRSIRAFAFAEATRGRWARSLGIGLVGLAVVMATFGPMLAPHDPFAISGGSLVAPTGAHPMGTDALGRDILSGLLFGARTSDEVSAAWSFTK